MTCFDLKKCRICPRECGADRSKKNGFCKSGTSAAIARADLHMWEEPCISGTRGSGTVFFSGCTLRCVFCQNHAISHGGIGAEISDKKLADIFLKLADKGAHNINLVNPTHFTSNIINALDLVKHRLEIPVVWNSGGYENTLTIRTLAGYVDIFLPDLKYVTPEISAKYSGASDYFEKARAAIHEMIDIAGYPVFSDDGIMKKGVLIRHLILPSHMAESKLVIDRLADGYDTKKLWVSLMCQYFPAYKACEFPEISRRLTSLEYQRVTEYARSRGIVNGFLQEHSSAVEDYVPVFSSDID